MKKRILSVFLIMMFILAGCGGDKPSVKEPVSNEYINSSSEDGSTESENTDSSYNGDSTKYNIFGGAEIYENLLVDEEENKSSGFQIVVEKNKDRNTLNTPWRNVNNCPATSVVEAQAQKMREAVLNTKNTSEYYSWSGRTFYVSPDGDDKNDGLTPQTAIKTLDADAYTMYTLQPGDAVLFERGGIWRLTNKIKTRKGVTFGSYGEGPKPAFYGSAQNYADSKYWNASNKENIWKVTVATSDVGLVVFNEGEAVGTKKFNGITVLEKNGDYYYNTGDDTLYVYFDKGNPGKYYKDIEIGSLSDCFGVGKDDITIDNFCIKYFSGFGVAMCGNNNTKITNCEMGFIGGRIQSGTLRLGNCIQQWNSTDKQLIENNWLYQAYDTGYTWQGTDTYETGVNAEGEKRIGDKAYYKDITVINNVIEYCNYAIETWHDTHEDLTTSEYDVLAQVINFKLNDNMFRYNGYGWGGIQRPDKWGYAIYGGASSEKKNAKNCEIKNNVLDMSLRVLVRWEQRTREYLDGEGMWDISGNSYYQTYNKYGEAMHVVGLKSASSQDGLVNAVASFEKNPGTVLWLEND